MVCHSAWDGTRRIIRRLCLCAFQFFRKKEPVSTATGFSFPFGVKNTLIAWWKCDTEKWHFFFVYDYSRKGDLAQSWAEQSKESIGPIALVPCGLRESVSFRETTGAQLRLAVSPVYNSMYRRVFSFFSDPNLPSPRFCGQDHCAIASWGQFLYNFARSCVYYLYRAITIFIIYYLLINYFFIGHYGVSRSKLRHLLSPVAGSPRVPKRRYRIIIFNVRLFGKLGN